jgi:hypothetical protein
MGQLSHVCGSSVEGRSAKASGISASSVRRIWRSHGLQSHRLRQFKLPNDPQLATKLRNITGL